MASVKGGYTKKFADGACHVASIGGFTTTVVAYLVGGPALGAAGLVLASVDLWCDYGR